MFPRRITRSRLAFLGACTLFAGLLGSGCGPQQAYPGASLPKDKIATLRINPPQAQIGFQLLSIDDRPFHSEVAVTILPGKTKLTLNVWPTSATTFQMSDAAFSEHYQRINNKYGRTMSITFPAKAGLEYGLNGSFNEGTAASESSYAVNVFEIGSGTVVARSSSKDLEAEASAIVDHARESDRENWSLEAGPGS
jgi:hypothetical protein